MRNEQIRYKIGAHVSISGGVSKSVFNALRIGANSFAMFLRSPRRWSSQDISNEEAKNFASDCIQNKYDPKKDIVVHGSYFINLSNPNPESEQKAYNIFIDDLKRCEKLGIGLYNLHPGSTMKSSVEDSLKRLSKNINKAIKETKFVKILLENMSGQQNTLGSNFQDLKTVIDLIDDKSRVGVCIDTCHAFASGMDISNVDSYNKFWDDFDCCIGRKYLFAMHLNDSKGPLSSKRDLHQKIGLGFIGLETFRLILNDERLENIPLILETPIQKSEDEYGEEIKLLETLNNKLSSDNFVVKKSLFLSSLGENERKTHQLKFDLKKSKKKTVSKCSASTVDVVGMLSKKKKS